MRAIVYTKPTPVDGPGSFVDLELARPGVGPHDLLVAVEAVSVNPADVKRRAGAEPTGDGLLGFDASGTVVEVGDDVTLFAVGDEVFYAGSSGRPGANAELHAVDERLVGRKPRTLSFAEAAALPLTSLTAWEGLVSKLRLTRDTRGTLLVIGAAGGVGSMVVQLAKTITSATVIGTASRDETRDWLLGLGADHVVDHSRELPPQLAAIAPDGIDWVFSTQRTDENLPMLVEVLKPFGQIVAIDDPQTLDVTPLKRKALSFHWELMFVRSAFQTPDMVEQHRILDTVAELVESGALRSTLSRTLTPFDAASLREAHRIVESGRSIGKVVVSRA
ncbi:zinc-binding alcohol dehydrogenase family protein [Herbiconiux daphne]|uniref:Zinc-type alcohol dehydrogenase-like protein n=1 Tax=Herbiconiux daphne TaxID=2970914 RepID=A0ABT2H125_9MICO|nr:zinc-binding alcohol dehydrogenase family protein [Herbiconiux daphne]MCS5733638.1 zinc-binding alcohol dehydrogenase family protein [Herbiconiux daphne]